MTRELKLALIVGFALVLLVTVLISDHLSKARKAEMAPQLTDAVPAVLPEPQAVPAGPLVTIAQGQGGGVTNHEFAPVMVGPGPGAQSGALLGSSNDPQHSPTIASRAGEPITAPPLVDVTPAGLGSGLGTGTLTVSQTPVLTGGGMNSAGQTPQGASVTDVIPPGFEVPQPTHITNSPDPAKLKQQNPLPTTPVDLVGGGATATQVWHTVADGDSAFKIAKKYYGKGELWTKILDANKDRMGEKGQLRPGVKLLIPSPESVGVKAPAKPAQPSESRIAKGETATGTPNSAKEPKPEPTKAGKATTRVYVVRKGDTLGVISQRELGSSKRVDDILKLNTQIQNPNALREGMKLTIPQS